MAVIIFRHQFVGNQTFEELHLWQIPITLNLEQKKHTFDLLLDTGAEKTVIVPGVKDILGIHPSQDIIGTGIGGRRSYSCGTVDNLAIGSINLGELKVLIGALPSKLSDYNIFGVLGADVLRMLRLEVDYPTGLLVISRTICLPSGI